MSRRPHIGRIERIALPEWGIRSLRAKVDTGAHTSSIHVDSIDEIGEDRIRFEVMLSKRPDGRRKVVEADVVRRTRIRPSTGRAQRRFVVATLMCIGELQREIEISLFCRKGMRHRMLLGRTAISGEFLVDPDATYLLGAPHIPRRFKFPSKGSSS